MSSSTPPPNNEWPTHDDILHPAINEDMNIHQLPGDVETAVEADTFDNEYDGIMTADGGSKKDTGSRRGSTVSTAMSSISSTASSVISATNEKVSNMEPKKKKKVLLIGMCAVFLAVIIGLSVGIAKRNKSNAHGSGGESLSTKKKPTKKVPEGWHQDRIEDVFGFVSLYSNKEVLLDENSPQHKACVWMAVKDELQLKTPTDYYEEANIIEENSNVHVTINQDHYRFLQRYLLAVLYYALNGDEWKSRLNFGNNVHECQWFEETKGKGAGINYKLGVQCDDGEHVSGLTIPNNNLKGQLPEQIGYLKNLQYMILPNNAISGIIPNEIAESDKLNVINLIDNDLSGPLPSTFGRMEQLKSLELSNNNINGNLPPDMKKLKNLQTLSLHNNDMDGDILSVISQIPSLENVYLSRNMFTGTLNSITSQSLPNLVDLVLKHNQIGGSLPASLFYHPTLKVLDLSYNNVQGPIPNPLPENNVLEYLSLAKNQISGVVPESIYSLSALTHLDVSENNINGDIPFDLDKLVHLQYLFLDRNNFNPGEIPEKPFKDMTQLKQLTLGHTGRTGELPLWIAYLEQLTLFDISQHDQLTGIGDYYCMEMPNLHLFSANCALIEKCNCCTCCDPNNDLDCIDTIQMEGEKNNFAIPVKSFYPNV